MNLINNFLTSTSNSDSPMPGLFVENSNTTNDAVRDSNDIDDQSNAIVNDSSRNHNIGYRIIKYLLKLPVIIMYFTINILLVLIQLMKPFRILYTYYHKQHQKQFNYQDNLDMLFNTLVKDSDPMKSAAEDEDHIYTFESLYSGNGILSSHVFKGTYPELLNICTEQCKFAILYIHDPLLDDKAQYINDILCTEQFVNMMRKYQCLIWFSDSTHSEGLQVLNSFKVERFPYLGCLSLNESFNSISIYRLEGRLYTWDPNVLNNCLAKEYQKLIKLRQTKQNIELQRIIKLQQDSRYNLSLQRDQERERLRRQERDLQIVEQVRQNKKLQWLKWKRSTLLSEPSDSINSCRVAIRFEDGSRIVRRFDKTLPIDEIYAFVDASINEEILNSYTSDEILEPPNDYEHQYPFILATSVPRRQLNPSTLIENENSIYPSGNIIVEQIN
ncbi:hypothetical protein TPHA_0G01960 [Tetrapisispora phaffii CBS 4417]|uniref:UBX domain-containing protein n=1 Tax=Tetrapisispora phaffii (strain ATCC 24235 / CBS 4417 / NBRC 1672 / NRRL Y-8282 / UCD 70-5) TaxID=1071381 RepID=G8BVV4_TETPH|nr:hypothetical protein TPHA_0G01960 [Tetrapisispora phaffii CBS 4417]CCE64032.1 hypothetical protein TPHA_0G01960 [Tetrapisispora phaffii CBS 4417]